MTEVRPFFHRIRPLQDPAFLKLLADPTRMALLRHLMAGAATLSQLSKLLGSYPAQTRHHLKLLEEAGLIELVNTRVAQSFVEKYYQATARAFVVNLTLLPMAQEGALVVWGSDDPLLDVLAHYLQESVGALRLFTLPVGSLDGLIALRQGLCQLAGCHLWDVETGEYNTAHVQRLFPGVQVGLLALARRQQGLLVAAGNPLHIQGVVDLGRPDVRLANRMQGTGTRLWLDAQLRALGISGQAVRGYETAWKTHVQVAQAVAAGTADAGIATLAAGEGLPLEFVPLFEEQFDLAFVAEQGGVPADVQALVEFLQTAECQQLLGALPGYDLRPCGEIRWVQV